ncbi:MAG TPA: hypothetical protein VK501_05360, partial [Baekduia sp.]|uniref:hypothetical protein n=1 Tax=Baekduia sp. TaxID=2600305 RepID=UPI002BB9FE5D
VMPDVPLTVSTLDVLSYVLPVRLAVTLITQPKAVIVQLIPRMLPVTTVPSCETASRCPSEHITTKLQPAAVQPEKVGRTVATSLHVPALLGPVGPMSDPVAVVVLQIMPTRCDGVVTWISNFEAGAVAENTLPGDADPLLVQLTADAVDAETSADATVAAISNTFTSLLDMRSSSRSDRSAVDEGVSPGA